jgi:hypothetical protein
MGEISMSEAPPETKRFWDKRGLRSGPCMAESRRMGTPHPTGRDDDVRNHDTWPNRPRMLDWLGELPNDV